MADYIAQADLEAYLGRSLTAAEVTQFATVAAAVTQAIDRYTGRTWDGTSITGERHTVMGTTITLKRAPVAAVSQVRVRQPVIGAAWRVLVAGTGYEVLDAAQGTLLIEGVSGDVITTDDTGSTGDIAEVTYTVTGGVPAPVKLAAEQLAAAQLTGAQASTYQAQGVKRYSVGGELTVEYVDNTAAEAALPASVRTLLAPYRRPVVFA